MPEPFQVVERFAVVGNSESEDMNARNKEIKGNGTRVFKPQPDAYSGNLYVLVDGGSFSNSGIVASAIRHYRRGVIIGEETGGNEKVLCGYESLTVLPNTRLQVYIPTRQFVIRDMPGNEGRGVIPDFIISPSIQGLISGKDEVLEYCIGLIKDKQGLK
jgi:C-terminal processing protease CtpA/Prc